MEQYADEFERECAALRARLATEENKSRHLEAELDALREQNGKLERVIVHDYVYSGYRDCGRRKMSTAEQVTYDGVINRLLNPNEAALSATEVK